MSATVEAPRAQRREIRCGTCNYGAVVDREPTRCPMCGNRSWVALELEAPTVGSAVQPRRS
jgi:primosomal protein N'